MKLVRYLAEGGAPRAGAVDGSVTRDLGRALLDAGAAPDDTRVLLSMEAPMLQEWLNDAAEVGPVTSTRLLAPIGNPPRIFALAANFYRMGAERQWDGKGTTPYVFIKPSTCISGPEDLIPWHPFAAQVIEEIELGVVIGRRGREVQTADALSYVGGYTVFNDVSARRLDHPQLRRNKEQDARFDWLNGKWFDGYAGMGPWIVAADELPNPGDLRITTTVSGQQRFSVSTERMILSVAEAIAYISRISALEPGDVIAMGVYHGGGEEIMLQPGDVIEGEIEGIGTLRQHVAARG